MNVVGSLSSNRLAKSTHHRRDATGSKVLVALKAREDGGGGVFLWLNVDFGPWSSPLTLPPRRLLYAERERDSLRHTRARTVSPRDSDGWASECWSASKHTRQPDNLQGHTWPHSHDQCAERPDKYSLAIRRLVRATVAHIPTCRPATIARAPAAQPPPAATTTAAVAAAATRATGTRTVSIGTMNNYAANATKATNLYLRTAVDTTRAADTASRNSSADGSTSASSATECRESLATAASEASTASEATSDCAGEMSVRARQSLFSQALLASRSRR
jgi:hypothetical protein